MIERERLAVAFFEERAPFHRAQFDLDAEVLGELAGDRFGHDAHVGALLAERQVEGGEPGAVLVPGSVEQGACLGGVEGVRGGMGAVAGHPGRHERVRGFVEARKRLAADPLLVDGHGDGLAHAHVFERGFGEGV